MVAGELWRVSHPDRKEPGPSAREGHTEQLWLIDLVGAIVFEKLGWQRKIRNLARLHASFHASPHLTRTDKLRFVRVYLQWGLFGRHRWKRWIA